MGLWYQVAEANSYLVITGVGIDRVLIKKKAMIYPFQKVTRISVTPFDFSMELQAMSKEKLNFSLPAVFTIGPADDIDALTKYAVLLTGEADGRTATPKSGAVAVAAGRNHIQEIVKGVIEGETRSIVSTMTMEEIFQERQIFKAKVVDNVQAELEQFGLKIYNANVKELQDTPGSEYFSFLAKKAHEGASNQAKVDVADARMRGEVGEAEKQGKAKQEIAKIHAATAVLETERKREKAAADAKLTQTEIDIEKEVNLARILAKRTAEQRDTDLQKDLEQKRAAMELERLRATKVTQAKIDRESSQQKADADLYKETQTADGVKYRQTVDADAALYRKTRDAEAMQLARQKEADAAYYAAEKEAEANFIRQKRRADGMREEAGAIKQMSDSLGGPAGYLQYMMIKESMYEKMANANAKAINGLQPKINVWNTGSAGAEGADPMAPMRNLMQMMPPMLSTIQDQTGIQPPNWFAQMPQEKEKPLSRKDHWAIPPPKDVPMTNGTK